MLRGRDSCVMINSPPKFSASIKLSQPFFDWLADQEEDQRYCRRYKWDISISARNDSLCNIVECLDDREIVIQLGLSSVDGLDLTDCGVPELREEWEGVVRAFKELAKRYNEELALKEQETFGKEEYDIVF